MNARPDLVAIIAQRIDSGARLNLQKLADDLGEDVADVRRAYRALAQRRGHDPLMHRAEQHMERLRILAGLPLR